MHVDVEGPANAPDLVLVHGGTGTGRFHWSKPLAALTEAYRVHLPDLPGHGRSPLPADGRYTREVLVGALATMLARFDAPPHVAAFSMGGHAALALAQTRPALFGSLTLIGVSVRDHDGLREWRRNFDPDELAARYPLWARKLSRIHAPLGGEDAWRDVCRRDAAGLRVDVDVDALAGLDCPVLLVRGDRDPAVDPTHYAELRAAWPQADEFVVPHGRHDVQLTRDRVVRPVLLEFLQRAA